MANGHWLTESLEVAGYDVLLRTVSLPWMGLLEKLRLLLLLEKLRFSDMLWIFANKALTK